MITRSLERRIESLESDLKSHSTFDPACICFPGKRVPKVGWPLELVVAAAVKCPLHGDRFDLHNHYFVCVAKWVREKIWSGWLPRCSEQYRKAYYAGFPRHLWPAEEETTENGTYLLLKDGSRLQVTECAAGNSGNRSLELPITQLENDSDISASRPSDSEPAVRLTEGVKTRE